MEEERCEFAGGKCAIKAACSKDASKHCDLYKKEKGIEEESRFDLKELAVG